jgi:ubiquinone biosynthesis protein
MGRIDRRARQWLAEILYGLTTGNYRRVAEIHFEAQYVPSHHSVDEFATACAPSASRCAASRSASCRSGMMLDGLFAITRDFDMQTQPHLLLLQKTMVMVEGIATTLHPRSTCGTSRRRTCAAGSATSSGPEAALADRLREDLGTLLRLPELIRRIEDRFPAARRCARAAAAARSRARVGAQGAARWPGYLAAALGGRGRVDRRARRLARLTVARQTLTIARQGRRRLVQGWPYGGSKARLAN